MSESYGTYDFSDQEDIRIAKVPYTGYLTCPKRSSSWINFSPLSSPRISLLGKSTPNGHFVQIPQLHKMSA